VWTVRTAAVIPFCDTPWQSVAAAVGGGAAGGVAGLALALDPAGVVVLAGVLGGLTDLGAHVVRRDPQFVSAVRSVRSVLDRFPAP
jgi:alkyl hydroperoxide reductase subunit AhpF